MAVKKGKLIVIDGIDGSGKATQTKILAARLKKEGVKVKTINFPQYYTNHFGKLIGEYLSGKYGDFIQVDPHIASVLYAADRFETSTKIRKWLEQGYMVISDRYMSANQIHQGGKIEDLNERKRFLEWLEKMEYGVFKIPRPNVIIYLDVPFEVSKEWLASKIVQRSKKYTEGRKDVAEDNLIHLKSSRDCALLLAKNRKDWKQIECCQGMVCMLPEEVHERVFALIKKRFRL